MHKSSIDHISHILENDIIFLHRVTTHKIQTSTNDANLLILKVLQSLAFPSHASTQHLNIKELFPTTTTILLSLQTQLFRTSLLLFGTISGKVPHFITMETYHF